VLVKYPLTLDVSEWYVGHSLFALIIVGGLTFLGLHSVLSRGTPPRAMAAG